MMLKLDHIPAQIDVLVRKSAHFGALHRAVDAESILNWGTNMNPTGLVGSHLHEFQAGKVARKAGSAVYRKALASMKGFLYTLDTSAPSALK
jgi:hypothetical protein